MAACHSIQKPVRAATIFLALLFALAVDLPPLGAVSANILISEFRVRGPNGGSDEFVELYNASAEPVDISGWKIRGSNASGTVSTRLTIASGTILAPGCYFLATNSSTAGGPYSGAVAGDQTYATGITDDGGVAVTLPDDTVIDAAGLSSGSAFREGTALSSLGTSNLNRSYERRPGGAAGSGTDTDNNAADFQLITASGPQNSDSACVASGNPTGAGTATPATVAPGDEVLLTVAVTAGTPPAPISGVTGNLTPIGGGAAQLFFDDGTNGDAAPGDNIYSFTLNVAGGPTPGLKTLAVAVTDAAARTGVASIQLTVPAAPPPFVAIHTIQGAGATSSFVGQLVETEGIVTARRFNDGFYIQTPDAAADANSSTSQGIFVFAGGPPPAVASLGNRVRVVGTVREHTPSTDPASPPLTELTLPTVTLLDEGHPLPEPVLITASDTNPSGPFDALERLEGMRVHIDRLTVVAPTGGSVSEANASSTSNGVFYAVIAGVGRPFREPGVPVTDPLPAGAPAGVLRFDTNPERLRVDSDGQIGAARLDVATTATVSNVTGVVDYAFRTYSILPDPSPAPVVTGGMTLLPIRAAAADEITIATANLQRFFDTANDPSTSDVVLTPQAFATRLNKASVLVRRAMRMPDIIGVQEVENLATLQALAEKVNADALIFGGFTPGYVAYLEEGNDIGGIDVGFLVKSSRISVLDVTQVGKTATFVDPRDGSIDTLNDRPPLVLRAEVAGTTGPQQLTIIVNHLRSLNDVNDPGNPGIYARAKRRHQAEFLAALIQSRQTVERLISIGDYNSFEFSDGLVDVLGTVLGTPAPADQVVLASPDIVEPNLTSHVSLLPADQRYSYSFDGNAQMLDHVLVSSGALPLVSGVAPVRVTADFPEVLRQNPNLPQRVSDHDPVVVYFRLPFQ